MIKILDLFFAARPMLHLPIWSVYLVTLALAGERPRPFGWLDLMALAALSFVAAGAYYLNQIHDVDSDRINGKLGFIERGCLSRGDLQAGYLIATLGGLTAAWFVSPLFLTISALPAVLGYIYSAPPWRLKDRPWAGLLANGLSYGLLIPLAAVAVGRPFPQEPELWLAAYFFLAVSSTHVLTTIPDRDGDAAVGKRTMAVVLSVRSARLAALLLVAAAAWPALMLWSVALIALTVAAMVVTLAALLAGTARLTLFAAKLPLMLLTLFAGYYYPYYLVFIVALLFSTRVYYRQRFGQTYPKLA